MNCNPQEKILVSEVANWAKPTLTFVGPWFFLGSISSWWMMDVQINWNVVNYFMKYFMISSMESVVLVRHSFYTFSAFTTSTVAERYISRISFICYKRCNKPSITGVLLVCSEKDSETKRSLYELSYQEEVSRWCQLSTDDDHPAKQKTKSMLYDVDMLTQLILKGAYFCTSTSTQSSTI